MTEGQPVKLRGHHLLCVLAYIGRGYTPEFTQNFNAIAERINQGAAIELIEGPDDICKALHAGDHKEFDYCPAAGAAERDRKAMADIGSALKISLAPGKALSFTPELISRLRTLFASGIIRSACKDCEWHGFCTGVAACGYDGVKLFPHAGR